MLLWQHTVDLMGFCYYWSNAIASPLASWFELVSRIKSKDRRWNLTMIGRLGTINWQCHIFILTLNLFSSYHWRRWYSWIPRFLSGIKFVAFKCEWTSVTFSVTYNSSNCLWPDIHDIEAALLFILQCMRVLGCPLKLVINTAPPCVTIIV